MRSVTKNVKTLHIYLCLLAMLCSGKAFAQKEAANWYFGDHAGLSFNTVPPVALLDGQLDTLEGCSAISTGDGVLQCYTDGRTVYNRNHQVMVNGTGLLGDDSSTQSGVIIPAPGNVNKYYVFTVAAQAGDDGLNYSVVDMTLAGGLGAVTAEKNIRLDGTNLVAEKITAVRHSNGIDVWVISHRMDSNRFIAFLITSAGINTTPVVTGTGSYVGIGGSSAIGYLKASPDGKRLASAKQFVITDFELFDFNSTTGVVSNPMKLSSTDPGYGVEFSPDSKRVYFTGWTGDIYQYDATQTTLAATIATRTVIATGSNFASLQLALDGKIYVVKNNFTKKTSLAVINSPNNLGAACNFQEVGPNLGGRVTKLGLPPFIQSFFRQDIEAQNLCAGSPTNLSISINANIVSAQWNFGDGGTSTDINAVHTYALPGTYTVTVDFFIDANSTVIHLTKDITILPLPVATQPTDMAVCSTGGPTTFDLTQQTTAILNGQSATNFNVTYYASQADLDNNTAITTITHSLNSQTILAKVTNTVTGCFSLINFETIRNAAPIVAGKENLKACGQGTLAIFDLTTNTPLILGSQDAAAFTIKYYTTAALANTGDVGTEIATPDAFTSSDTTVYARIYNTLVTNCFEVTPFTLTTTQNQILNPAGNPFYYNLCAPQGTPNIAPVTVSGIAGNLTNQAVQPITLLDPAATQDNDLANYTITYHELQADALTGDNPIVDGYTATNGQIVYIRVSYSLAQSCVATGQLQFNIATPQAAAPTPLFKCSNNPTGTATFNLTDKNNEISVNTAYTISYYDNQADALNGSLAPLNAIAYDGTDFQVVYARVEDIVTGCATVVELTLRVIPAPIADQPSPIAVCDDNTDTFATFDLLPSMQAIEAALGNVTVSAFETQSDADLNVNAIPNPGAYRNIYPVTQTIYLRVQSTLTECYDTVTLVLIVNPRPAAATPAQAYALCDDGASDSDGQAIFNLNTQSAAILNGLDPVQYTIAYYRDAAATDLIATPGNFLSPTATVYAKVTNTATGCSYTVPVRLVVNGLPVLITNQYVYSLCDTQAPGDKEAFDLTSVIGEFITPDNRNGVEVAFYKTLAAAQAGGTSPELIPYDAAQAYENEVPQVQSLYVRFTTGAGCYRIGFLDIRVEPKPVIEVPLAQELTVCATNNQGIGEFDLESLIAGMANGAANLDITFHLTETDAAQGLNAIPNPENYRNEYPYMQTIWVRVVNTISGCSNDPYEITLYVNPAPVTIPLANITLCDDTDNNGQNGSARFDITLYEADLIAAAAPTPVTITYYTTRENADAGTGGIVNPTTYTVTTGQVIWVRVEDGAGCYSITSFTITFNKPHLLINPTPLTICETVLPNDGIAVFVLTYKDDEILGAAGVGRNYTVEYFEQDPRVTTGAVAIATPGAYTNTTSPTTLYVRVTTPQGCVSYTTLTLRVLPLPVPNFAPTPLEVCDNDQSVTGSEVFNLTLAAEQIRNSGSNYVLTYYTSEQDAIDGVNAIPDPTQHNSASGTVYVKVTADTNNPADPGCYQIVALELIVNPLPPIADLADYGICNDSPADPTAFNLKEYVETALGGNTNNEYAIEYYQDAALSIPAVPITAYVVSGRATVYIRVVDNATGCALVKELELIVEQQAVANPVTNPGVACDTDGANDGVITTWDLTPLGAQALGTQDPGVFVVSYYDIDPATVPAPAAITDPANYTNITADSQQIWIVVTNSDSVQDTPCQGVTTVTLTVERLPVPDPKDGTICVDIITEALQREYVIESGLDATHTFVWEKDGQVIAGATGPDYTATEEGEYTVTATSANGCASLPVTVTVTKSGTAVVNPANPRGYYVTNYFSDNQTITVDVVGYGKYEYILDEGTPQSSPVFTNVAPGSHTIRIVDTNANACAELVLTSVSVVDYPNFFTPNGDGFHDTWNIIGLQDTGSVIYIFDRYGKLIKQISPDSEGWDGTMNGHPVPATDYWFSVTYPEFDGTTTVTKEFKAHFSLKR